MRPERTTNDSRRHERRFLYRPGRSKSTARVGNAGMETRCSMTSVTMHTLTIPDFIPQNLNRLLRTHWAKRNRAIRADADLVAVLAMQAGIPKARGKRRLSLAVTTNTNVAPDADNLLKAMLDALVKARLLIDDSPRWVELAGISVSRADRRETRITLEDVVNEIP